MIPLIVSIVVAVSLLLIYLVYFVSMRQYSKRGINWISNSIDAKVTLIIATYNEEATLPAKLKNVLDQDFPKEKLELLVIDSGSTDRTPTIVEEFIRQNPSLKIVFIREKERLGKSHALNIAYPRASGEIKIISDSDSLLEKSAITHIVSNFSDPRIGAAFGRQVLLNAEQNPSTLLEKSYRNVWEVLRQGESILDSTPIFDGELSAFRGNLIEQLPENKSADDSRLANIIRRKGYRAVCDPSAIFYEYAPPTSRAMLIQKVRRGQGLIRLFWDFKDCMFRRKYGKYGQLILPMEFFMHSIFPTAWLVLLLIFFASLVFYSPILLLSLLFSFVLLFALSKVRGDNRILNAEKAAVNLLLSFLSMQLFLFYALMLWISGRSLHKWQKVDDIRKQWKTEQ
jgi:cellulose synthase/poly-beta-1,6-N-acetylglucosamine synthase-like glycosyltransferase